MDVINNAQVQEEIKKALTTNLVVGVKFTEGNVVLALDNGEAVAFSLGMTIKGFKGSMAVQLIDGKEGKTKHMTVIGGK